MSMPSLSACRSMVVKRMEAVLAEPFVRPSVFHDRIRMSCFLQFLTRVAGFCLRLDCAWCVSSGSGSLCSSCGLEEGGADVLWAGCVSGK